MSRVVHGGTAGSLVTTMTLAGGGQPARRPHDVWSDIRRFMNERRAILETTRAGIWAARLFDNKGDRSAGLPVGVEPRAGHQLPSEKPLRTLSGRDGFQTFELPQRRS